jgi:dTDP-4-amino-4,6-dideoxygalactose transaminase
MGEAAAFSFCQDKIISTGGEGGMLVTNDRQVWQRAWGFKDHGKSYSTVYHHKHLPGFRWLHEGPGTNWRMTEMQAALGRVLLPKVPNRVATRRFFTARLDRHFAKIQALRTVYPDSCVTHAYYKHYAYVRPERLKNGWNRDCIAEAISAEGIPCGPGSCSEIYLEKAIPFELRPCERHPIARALGETSLMFLVHPTLTEEDIQDTVRAVEKVMTQASATRFADSTAQPVSSSAPAA